MAGGSSLAAKTLLAFRAACLLIFSVNSNSVRAEQGLLERSETGSGDRRSFVLQGKLLAWGNGPHAVNGLFDALAHRRHDESTAGRRQRCRRSLQKCLQLLHSKARGLSTTPAFIKRYRPQHDCQDYFQLRYLLTRVSKLIVQPTYLLDFLEYKGLFKLEVFLVERNGRRQKFRSLDTEVYFRKLRADHPSSFLLTDLLEEGKMYKVKVTDEGNDYFCKGYFFLDTDKNERGELRWL